MLSKRPSSEPITQQSKLLPSLFEHIDEDQRLTVFHVGLALPETVDFFSRYRCKLHFVDLFAELPIVSNEENNPSLGQQFGDLLRFSPGTRFDICLFWDLFNFLDSDAITAFLKELRPYLHTGCLAHGFSVHNLKSTQSDQLYGIREIDTLRLRARPAALPAYAPHNQGRLKTLLSGFTFERSVLLPDSRLELLLRAKA
ncbi:MAG: hypothetical protein DRR04_08620 [Gammaproteobacteria bacterium]|nr:MAG: hypothetical protein DRQ97_01405 [Gammaproteobacteria bacterium]RLA59382.1 MAG: hypothetical protein DRR04_08620 [Gammaproteobacteria bacterium]